jgi:hypothetical protein
VTNGTQSFSLKKRKKISVIVKRPVRIFMNCPYIEKLLGAIDETECLIREYHVFNICKDLLATAQR